MRKYLYFLLAGLMISVATPVMAYTIEEILDRAQGMETRQSQLGYLKQHLQEALDNERYYQVQVLSGVIHDVQLDREGAYNVEFLGIEGEDTPELDEAESPEEGTLDNYSY